MPKNKINTEICEQLKKKIKKENESIIDSITKTETTNNDKENPTASTSSNTNNASAHFTKQTTTSQPNYDFWQKINKGKESKLSIMDKYIKIKELQEGKL